MLNKCFTKKYPLHKIFNRHNHNKTVISNYTPTPATQHVKECNCRKKEQCPLEGLANNIVYQATIKSNTTTETYVGLATNFKERYKNHTSSFRNHKKKKETELSKYIWTLKDANKPFSIKWRILRKCKPYNNISKKCNPVSYTHLTLPTKLEV